MAEPAPADERILQAAMRRFAVDGLGAPLRAVAQDAGVSAGLIIHHFGSREKLLEACDRRALEVTRQQKRAAVTGGVGTMLAQLAAVEQYAPETGYVLRRLQAGGPLARRLIEDFIANARDYHEEGERAGVLSPSRDPEARVRVLAHMALGSLVLQMPGQRAPMDLEDLPRWMREYTDSLTLPLLELYTTPLLTDASLLDAYLAAQGDAGTAADEGAHTTDSTSPTDGSPT
ncbi:TetR family transcriptional regulator [Brachybacterium paraconglomeratum]